MREGYTYDDEMPSSQGSYVNRGRRIQKFTGKKVGTIHIDPKTREIVITALPKEDQEQENKEETL